MKREWTLVDGDARAAEHPATWGMPPRADRQRLKRGAEVKLGFETVKPKAGDPYGERMWVRVTEASASIPRRYVGVLISAPTVTPLSRGDKVEFGPEHVIQIGVPAKTETGRTPSGPKGRAS